jgi:hypothetical protein
MKKKKVRLAGVAPAASTGMDLSTYRRKFSAAIQFKDRFERSLKFFLRRENMKQKHVGYCSIFAAVVVLLTVIGCNNPVTTPSAETYPPGQGKIVVSVSSAERTLIPELKFSHIRVELIPTAAGIEPVITQFEGDGGEIALLPGVWTVKLYGYIDTNQPPIATGTVEDIEIVAGRTTWLTVSMAPEPITSKFIGEGYLSLNIKTPPDIDIDAVTITAASKNETVTITDTSTPTVLKPGYYLLSVDLKTVSGARAVFTEIAWIYPSISTIWTLEVQAEDFAVEEGQISINMLFNPEDNPPVFQTSISEIQRGNIVQLRVQSTHKEFEFYVDSVLQPSTGTGCTITIDTDDLAIGGHLITVVGYNESGIPWTTSLRLTILPKKQLETGVRVTTSAEFIAAINDPAVSRIILEENLTSDPLPAITRTLAISGQGERVISLASNGSLFSVTGSGNLTLKEITVKGRDTNTDPLITVTGGTLTLGAGSRVTANTRSGINQHIVGGGVYATDNARIELQGGIINDNHIKISSSEIDKAVGAGAGIYLRGSTLLFSAGYIQENTIEAVNSTTGASAHGAGIAGEFGSTIKMDGGVIRSNHAWASSTWWTMAYGSAGMVSGKSTFTMTGGIISGNTNATNIGNSTSGPYFTEENNTWTWHELGSHAALAAILWSGLPTVNKTGGIIYGIDATGYDSDGFPLQNKSGDGGPGYGHAVFTGLIANPSVKHFRDTTAGEDIVLNSDISGPQGGWE